MEARCEELLSDFVSDGFIMTATLVKFHVARQRVAKYRGRSDLVYFG